MNRLRNIINFLIAALIVIYGSVIILLQFPIVQNTLGGQTAAFFKKQLGTEVQIGKINLGFLNRLIVDDFLIYDEQHRVMVKAGRLSVKIPFSSILQGQLHISSIQLFGADLDLYKDAPNQKANYEFFIEALSKKNKSENSPLDLKINSLIIRNGRLHYHQNYIRQNRSSLHHFDLSDISGHLIITHATDYGFKAKVKQLSFREKSGFEITDFKADLDANNQVMQVNGLHLSLKGSDVNIPFATIRYPSFSAFKTLKGVRYTCKINPSIIDLKDLIPLSQRFKKVPYRFKLNSLFSGSGQHLLLDRLNIDGQQRLCCRLKGLLKWGKSLKTCDLDVDEMRADKQIIQLLASQRQITDHIPFRLTSLGDASFVGKINYSPTHLLTQVTLNAEVGKMELDLQKKQDNLSCVVKTDKFDLGRVIENKHLGIIQGEVRLDGVIKKDLHANAKIQRIDYKDYTYQNIHLNGIVLHNIFDGKISADDPNIKIDADGQIGFNDKLKLADLKLTTHHIKPYNLNLTRRWKDYTFKFESDIHFKGAELENSVADISMRDLWIDTPEEKHSFQVFGLQIDTHNKLHQFKAFGDLGELQIRGEYHINTIMQSIKNMIAKHLPTLPDFNPTKNVTRNEFNIQATLTDTKILQVLWGFPLQLNSPLNLTGIISDNKREAHLILTVPDLVWKNKKYKSMLFNFNSTDQVMKMNAYLTTLDKNQNPFYWDLFAHASENKLSAAIKFRDRNAGLISGQVEAEGTFYKNKDRKPEASIQILPSEILVKDDVWQIRRSKIIYSPNHLSIDSTAIQNGRQYLKISGTGSKNPNDTIAIQLSDLNVDYVLDLVNFDAVKFGGNASGHVSLSSLFSVPQIDAKLDVSGFTFQGGFLGDLHLQAQYKDKHNINIDAVAQEGSHGQTLISGYISPVYNNLELDISANNSNLKFLQGFCGTFLKDVEANGTGRLKLYGPLDKLDLSGDAVARGALTIIPTNVNYHFSDAHIALRPGCISLCLDTLKDRHEHQATINGDIKHTHFRKMTYDLNIKGKNILAFDLPQREGELFASTIYATGTCGIRGYGREFILDIEATAEPNSTFFYDAATPTNIESAHFIKWNTEPLMVIAPVSKTKNDSIPPISSDVRINFVINCLPAATIKVLLDHKSGDGITLKGNGVLKASYYNKGDFNMYGNYIVQDGSYNMTVRNLLKREFKFRQGGTIGFSGDPFHSMLDLTAVYTANGVSLSDLNIGKNFSANSTKVDCIMHIKGTPEQPKVDFDLDLPNFNSDVKQMVYNLIKTEEEMNQQVLYLLTIGRLYMPQNGASQDNQHPSQTALAMQCILSGTLSHQLSTIFNTMVNNNNWNLGANITAGNDGWNNAEYEGLLSGRMFNDRLQFNGQFGYRDNPNFTNNFIGDFDFRYLLIPNGNMAIKFYNQTNDRYFTRNSINTQGIGLMMKKDFDSWKELFSIFKKRKPKKLSSPVRHSTFENDTIR